MSKIRLHGSSSGYTEIAPVAASGNNTLTLPNDGTIISKDSNGAVGVTSITVGTGVTIGDGRVTCTTVHGSAASLTSIPAANIVGVCTSGLTKTGGFGGLVKLQSANSTSAVSAIEFTSLDVTTYRAFKLICSLTPATDDVVLYFRWKSGSSYMTSSEYNYILDGANGAGSAFRLANEEDKVLVCNNMGNQTLEGASFELNLVPNVSGDTAYGNFGYSTFTYYTASSSHRAGTGAFTYKLATNTDGFEIYHNTGNIAAYNYVLYGVKR